jgi:hypothetical protein
LLCKPSTIKRKIYFSSGKDFGKFKSLSEDQIGGSPTSKPGIAECDHLVVTNKLLR